MTAASLHTPATLPRPAGQFRVLRAGLRRTSLPLVITLYLVTVVVPIAFQVGPLMMTTLRIMLLILTIPLVVQLLAGRLGPIILTDILFLLHILWAIVSLAINNPDRVVEQAGSVGVEFLGGYLMGRAYIRNPETFAALCRVLVVIVCCTFPIALFETTTGRPLLLELIGMLPGVQTLPFNFQEPRMGLERVQLGFAHPIHYGLFCSVAFALAFVALDGLIDNALRLAATALIGFCGFLALSSGALLALVLQVGLIGWYLVFSRVNARWWLLTALFAFMYILIDILSNRTPIRVFMSYATFSAHTAYWRGLIFEWGMVNVRSNPLFGLGLNDWVRPTWMNSGSMDNFWLVMAVRYGVPGFLLVALGYALVIVRVMRKDFRDDLVLSRFRRAWVFTFLGLSFTLCTVHVWTNIYSFVFFMFGAGIWMIQASTTRSSEDPGTSLAPISGSTSPAVRSSYSRFPIQQRLVSQSLPHPSTTLQH